MSSVKPETPNAAIRRSARNALRGHWNDAVSTAVTLLLAQLLCSTLTEMFDTASSAGFYMGLGVSAILQLFLSLLMDGALLLFLKRVKGENAGRGDLILPFRVQPDRYLIVSLIRMAITLVIFSPVLLVLLLRLGSVNFRMIFLIAWMIIGTVLSVIAQICFVFAPFLLLEDEELGAIDSMKKAFQMINGSKKEMFFCILPFFGLMVLAVCTLGLGMLWVLPYLLTTICEFYLSKKDGSSSSSPQET